jgi:hypothetical protein
MERISVQSSNLASVGYDLESATLEIEFVNGGVYQYFGVSDSVYYDLMNAPSKGRFFDQFVKKGGYSWSRIT